MSEDKRKPRHGLDECGARLRGAMGGREMEGNKELGKNKNINLRKYCRRLPIGLGNKCVVYKKKDT